MEPTKASSRLSQRAREVRPFIVMEVFERAVELEREGRSIIHLEVGEPDFGTPAVVREAGIRAIRDGHTHYTHSLGHPRLREAIAKWHHDRYGVEISPDNIVVTLGSSGAMLLAFSCLLDPGDEVLIPDPGYPCYPKFIRVLEGVPVPVPVKEEFNFQYEPTTVAKLLSGRSRALVLNSPSNPTGTMTAGDTIGELVGVLGEGATLISDEIYHGLVYEGKAHSVTEFTSEGIAINGFSKLFAMTGWRLGYAIVPSGLIRAIQRVQQNLFISAPDFAQHAAIVALEQAESEVERMCLEYDRRRRFLLESIKNLGLDVAGQPVGAFYVLLNVSSLTDNVYQFAFEVLEEAGVAVTPGVDFGANGEGYIRLCYATSMQRLQEGVKRLGSYLQSYSHSRA